MKVAIIKYNAGNAQSVCYALERLGIDSVITDKAEEIMKADKVIFPGVGEASTTMRYLKSNKLDKVIISLKQPVLGICLGLQLMCKYSAEGNTPCLGIFDQEVMQFIPTPDTKAMHIGWNQITSKNGWLSGLERDENMYFVHRYYVPVNPYTTATTDYGILFSAAMNKNNFYAVQFHPEKSAKAGEQILLKFLNV